MSFQFALTMHFTSFRSQRRIFSNNMFAATIMKVVYGITVKDSAEPYVSAAEKALEVLNAAGTPGAFLVDVLPILKYVPSWLPGAGFKKKAAQWR